jgi:flagellum-specific ATP synthase
MSLFDLGNLETAIAGATPLRSQGRVIRAAGLIVEASMPQIAVGTSCDIEGRDGRRLRAEVVGFSGNIALLMPLGDIDGICEGALVMPRTAGGLLPVGGALLGRIVDAALRPIDGGPAPLLPDRVPLRAPPPPAMQRRRIHKPFITGIRAIDAGLTLGEGQRVGAMAGPGVGKSVLLGMLARSADADVIVVGLIGERGREVREFVERDLGQGLARSVVIVATGDESPLRRVQAAFASTAVAEYFRAQGKRVLLLIDSLSRVAMAQREIGLASGEPPTSRGYPPSVFALLPRLVERAGNDAGNGSITAIYTVLSEGDDMTDPVADAARAALDGHLVLSRRLAEAGQFPAIDMLASISRVMTDVAAPHHLQLATQLREILAAYRDSADLIELGAYQPGSNPRVDRALRCIGKLRAFLAQGPAERGDLTQTLKQLEAAIDGGGVARG